MNCTNLIGSYIFDEVFLYLHGNVSHFAILLSSTFLHDDLSSMTFHGIFFSVNMTEITAWFKASAIDVP